MLIEMLIVFGLLLIAVVAISLFLSSLAENSIFKLFCAFSLLMGALIVFIELPKQNLGHPNLTIEPGLYRVGVIYRAGDYVNVGVEKGEKGDDRISFYQFPAKDFRGSFPDVPDGVGPEAGKKLELLHYRVVSEVGTHNVYELRPR